MQFFYLYKALAHPEYNGYVTPVTLDERLMHIQEAKRTLGSAIPWLCETMANDLQKVTGYAPNSEFFLDPGGKIVTKRGWSDPRGLREDLARLVGPVENPTTLSDLELRTASPPKIGPKGIVPRVRLVGRYTPLRIEAQTAKSKSPFYVKLRAEADQSFINSGKGKVYLGFHLDPIYGVFWNNLVAPVRYELQPPDGVQISAPRGEGPKVDAEKDGDPREFLMDVDRGSAKEPARLVFRYFACTDKMCNAVTQEYLVYWDAAKDAGVVQRPAGRRAQAPF